MKRFILVCLLLAPMMVIADDYIDANAPQWSDFAPKAFINIKEPKGVGKLNVTAKYWYDRKIEFENAMINCKVLDEDDERFSCYENLKLEQYKANNDYNAKIEARMNANYIQGMENRTDTMLPINGYLNNMTRFMPSEFR